LYSSLTILPQNQPQKNLYWAAIAKSDQEYKTRSQLLCRFDIKNSSTDHKYLMRINLQETTTQTPIHTRRALIN
jgi:hypothetical protein